MNDQPTVLERWGPVALAIVAILIAIWLANQKGWTTLTYNTDVDKIAALLGSLFVIALFLERSLAVLNNLLFGIEKGEAETEVQRAAETLASSKAAAALAPDADVAFAEIAANNITEATASYELALEKQREVDEKRQRLRLGVGFLVAVLIASVGVRTLGTLVTGTLAGRQASLFNFLDVLLSAGLLAGGSNGIATLIDAIRRGQPNTGGGARGSAGLLSQRLNWFGARSAASKRP